MTAVVAFLFFQLLSIATIYFSFCNGSTYVGCTESERRALLSFKQDLIDPSNRLASWIGNGDCCNWAGVICHNVTGHVLQLQLRNPHQEYFTSDYSSSDSSDTDYEAYMRSKLGGKINPSLLNLKHLKHLDLSFNDFEGIQIPGFLCSMHSLRYLNLSKAGFRGMIPQQLGNLSKLQYLDLNSQFDTDLFVENLRWITGLSLLKHLDLSSVNLSKASHLWAMINSLPSLEVLRLSNCLLQHLPQIPFANFLSLATLDLSRNQFGNSLIPSWVFGLSRLAFLDLSANRLEGPIVDGLENLTSLVHLDLSFNRFNSSIPKWLSRFNRLEYLSLSFNFLQGSISSALGNLTSIITLDVSYNTLEGRIPTSFGRLCNLRSISLSFLNLNSNISDILDIFSRCVSARLESLDISNNQLSGHLTNQLGRFQNLETLDLHNNSICGPIPSCLGELSSLRRLDLSKNKLDGTISQIHFSNLTRLVHFELSDNSRIVVEVNSDWVPPFQLKILRLGSCQMGPHFPSWLHSQKLLFDLDISNSGISDVIPDWFLNSHSQIMFLNLSHNQIHQEIPKFTYTGQITELDLSSNKLFGSLPYISFDVQSILDLSNNALTGSIFQFLCYGMDESKTTSILSLENNSLSGEVPDCWMNWQYLNVLNLGNNEFTGNLPPSMGNLNALQSLILRKNNFSGVIPFMSLENCTELEVLDAAENQFAGNVLTWLVERFTGMKILKLRSNNFQGLIPNELCRLSSLQILDLACNNLSGNIPSCINNFSAMVMVDHSVSNDISYSSGRINFGEHTSLVKRGIEYEYSTILNLVRVIDLSKNNFSGEIPREVTTLKALQLLNLSHNSLTGRIPGNIGAMREIQLIDFSANQLSGEIPESISNLTFLSYLNLADNNLTGRIPTSTQIQSIEASCFTGNDLCGSPLPKNCTATVETPELENGGGKDGDDSDEDGVDWFYVSMALGFVVGFCGLLSPLLISRRWRYIYCGFLNRLEDKIYFAARKFC
ncbi:hypothetical protein ACOSQ4_030784 [Xanthoceras sorbifolium]